MALTAIRLLTPGERVQRNRGRAALTFLSRRWVGRRTEVDLAGVPSRSELAQWWSPTTTPSQPAPTLVLPIGTLRVTSTVSGSRGEGAGRRDNSLGVPPMSYTATSLWAQAAR